jgi:hypothetical protein
MLRRLRENGPAVLVPLAWAFAATAHLDAVSTRTVLVAHVVMDVLLAAFAVLSWRDMVSGVLHIWRGVIVVGLGVTLVGTVAIAWSLDPAVLAATVLAWMLLPARALWVTGRRVGVADAPRVYTAGAALSVLGAVVYGGWFLTGGSTATLVVAFALVGIGQTAGIVNAVYQY